jgi:hypothetical protein
MINPLDLENAFQEYMANLSRWIPDGPIQVDLDLLRNMGIVNAHLFEPEHVTPTTSEQFYVIETSEKLTLFNNDFSVWIIPKMLEGLSTTMTLLAINQTGKPHLELVFLTSGVYNNSRLVLSILDHFLQEIRENEDMIVRFNRAWNT